MAKVSLTVVLMSNVLPSWTLTSTETDPTFTISSAITGNQSFVKINSFKVLDIQTLYLVYNEYIMCQLSLTLVLSKLQCIVLCMLGARVGVLGGVLMVCI